VPCIEKGAWFLQKCIWGISGATWCNLAPTHTIGATWLNNEHPGANRSMLEQMGAFTRIKARFELAKYPWYSVCQNLSQVKLFAQGFCLWL
jgi:hypothetical protein